MPLQRIENTAGALTVWGSALALIAEGMKWMSENVALITAATLLFGFFIQVVTSIYNQKRAREKHAIEMAILTGEMADRRTVERVDKIDAVA